MLRQCSSPSSLPESSCMQYKNAMNLVVETYRFWRCGNHAYCADDVAGTGGWQSGCWSSTWPPSLGWRTNQRCSTPFIPFLEALLTSFSRCCFLCGWFGFHASLFPPLFFRTCRWVLFFYVLFPFSFFSPYFLLHTSSCMLPCFPNIGDERNSRARKGNRCTIQMWDYTHIHPGLYIASVYIYIIYMLTSACGLLINLKKIVRVTTCLASELVRSCSCCRWGVHVLGWHINLSLSLPPHHLTRE